MTKVPIALCLAAAAVAAQEAKLTPLMTKERRFRRRASLCGLSLHKRREGRTSRVCFSISPRAKSARLDTHRVGAADVPTAIPGQVDFWRSQSGGTGIPGAVSKPLATTEDLSPRNSGFPPHAFVKVADGVAPPRGPSPLAESAPRFRNGQQAHPDSQIRSTKRITRSTIPGWQLSRFCTACVALRA
jgi:hypothetical protein